MAAPCAAPLAGAAASIATATRASSASVGPSNNCFGVNLTPRLRARAITCSTRIESPPSSKKLSWRPTRAAFSTSRQTSASVASIGPCGASSSPAVAGAGAAARARSAARSILPFAVTGSVSSTTSAAGTM
ncbi:non-ribosomal peptide synthase domain protein [Burkholderia pseudomallei]|nr:non-ribosomal peptide synthase domain protein [Burkholderia pseudomallei]